MIVDVHAHLYPERYMAVLARKAFMNKVIRDVIKEPSYIVNYQGPNARQATIETTVTMKLDGDEKIIGNVTAELTMTIYFEANGEKVAVAQ